MIFFRKVFLSFFIFLLMVFFSFVVFAGVSVVGSNQDSYNVNSYNNFYLSKPSLSITGSSSNTVTAYCNSYSNIDNSLVAVAFFRKNSFGYDKLSAYDIDIKYKKGNSKVSFSHTVKKSGSYKVFCVEAFDLNADGKFSADEIYISDSKFVDIGSDVSSDDNSKLFVFVKDSDGNLINPYVSIVIKDSDGKTVYSNNFVPSAGIILELDKYYHLYLDYNGENYDSSFYFKSENFDGSMSLKVNFPSSSSSSGSSTVDSVSSYISPSYSSSSDSNPGRFYFECRASGSEDFSKGKFYLNVGSDSFLLEKGSSGSNFVVYNGAADNSRSGYYRVSSKGEFSVSCKYVSSSGKVYYSYPKTFTYK